jgi:4-hydroxybenzoate polyprenyltransferase
MLRRFKLYLQLIRFDKPIGSYLVLWPTLIALWLASGGVPEWKFLIIFVLGTFMMRSAGCIVNDIADRDLDNKVQRTKNRPITAGKVSVFEALLCLAFFLLLSLLLVLQLNRLCLYIAFISLGLTMLYPFTKRFVETPQLFLGLAFATSVPMAFAAVQNSVSVVGWTFYALSLILPIAYDTMYAMVDREDDLKIGVKSTAISFGRFDKLIIALLQVFVLCLGVSVGWQLQLAWAYYAGLLGMAILFVYQQMLIKDRLREKCFRAFLNNHWALFCLFVGVVLST